MTLHTHVVLASHAPTMTPYRPHPAANAFMNA